MVYYLKQYMSRFDQDNLKGKKVETKDVLLHIEWSSNWSHYYLQVGAYDHEQEVVLMEGTQISIVSVTDV